MANTVCSTRTAATFTQYVLITHIVQTAQYELLTHNRPRASFVLPSDRRTEQIHYMSYLLISDGRTQLLNI